MPETRHLALALLAPLLLGLTPEPLAASGSDGTRPSIQAPAALSPSAVFAAFESNLVESSGRLQLPAVLQPTNRAGILSSPDCPQTFQIAAAMAQKTASVFKASLADSTPQALIPPSLSIIPDAISLSATVGEPTARRRLDITSLGGTVNWSATAQILNGSDWLRISPASGSVTANAPAALDVDVDYGALGTTPGLFQGLIQVTDDASRFVATVPVVVVLSVEQSRIGLSDSSVVLTIAGGGATPPAQNIEIFNRGTGLLNWSIPDSAVPPWLNASVLSGSAGGGTSQASQVTLSVNGPVALALSSGVYQTLLPIQAPEANNSPQLVAVTLQRVPGSTPPTPGIRPGGLVFVAREGGVAPTPKGFTVANWGGGSLTANFNVSTANGGNWLSTSDTWVYVTSASGPLTTQVAVNPAGLSRGTYSGSIQATFSGGETLDVGVVLIVTPPIVYARLAYPSPAPLQGCTPDSMELIAETIGNGASVPISFPQVLVVSLIDSCGEVVDDATVVASAEGINIPMQALGNGTYSGTWVPQQQGESVPVSFVALHPTLPRVDRTLDVSTAIAAEGIQLPVLATDGVVEAAGLTPRRPLALGGFISLFGSRFTTETRGATQIPLESELAGVRVQIGGVDAPLLFVSPTQINAQLPVEFEPGADVPIVVNSNGVLTAPQSYVVAPTMPGIFIVPNGPAILRSVPGQGAQPVTADNPVRIGDVLEIFATGLGKTEPLVESGAAGPSFSMVTNPVSVEIGGIGVPVLYQGLAPGFVALYQVDVQVTDNVPTGDGLQIQLIQNGIVSNPDSPPTVSVVQP